MRLFFAATLALVGCSDNAGFPDARPIDAPPPKGTVSLAWSLVDPQGAPITCQQINATSVTLELHNTDAAGGFSEVFSCASAMGTTPADLPPGPYDITFALTGPGVTLATAPKVMGVVVKPGQNTELPAVQFTVDDTGGLNLHLTANQTGGNCAATGAMGAGIASTTITLQHTGGDCANVTLTIGAGASSPGGSYPIDCDTPTPGPCIETDQAVTVTGVDSGNYAIHVRGKNGAGTECWRNDDTLIVPAAGNTLTRTLNLGPTGNPGC